MPTAHLTLRFSLFLSLSLPPSLCLSVSFLSTSDHAIVTEHGIKAEHLPYIHNTFAILLALAVTLAITTVDDLERDFIEDWIGLGTVVCCCELCVLWYN